SDVIPGQPETLEINMYIRETIKQSGLVTIVTTDKTEYQPGELMKVKVVGYSKNQMKLHIEVWNEQASGKYIWTSTESTVEGTFTLDFEKIVPVGWPSTSTGADHRVYAATGVDLLSSASFKVGGTSSGDTNIPSAGATPIAATNGTVTNVLENELTLNGGTDATQMQFSNSTDFSSSIWKPYATSRTWELESGADGSRTVYARFSDDSGNATETYSVIFQYDSTLPVITGFKPIANSFAFNSNITYELSENAVNSNVIWTQTGGTADAGSPHTKSLTGAELNAGLHNDISISNAPQLVINAIYTVSVQVTDAAANDSVLVSSTNFTYKSAIVFVKHDAAGSNSGSSWTDAYNDLQSAIGTAVAGQKIWVAAGMYKPSVQVGGGARFETFSIPNQVEIYGGFNGTEADLNQRNVAGNETILDGDIGTGGDNTDNSYHVVKILTGNTAVLDGFSIQKGRADGANPENRGACFLIEGSGNATITNCKLQNTDTGATLAFEDNASGSLNITDILLANTGNNYALYVPSGSASVTASNITMTTGYGIGFISNTGNHSFANGCSITTSVGSAVNIQGGTCSMDYSGDIIHAVTVQPAVIIQGGHSSGTVVFQAGTINVTDGTGLEFNNADGTYNFTGTTTLNGGDAGIDFLTGSNGIFNFGVNTSITNPSGDAFKILGGLPVITYSGTIVNSAGYSVFISGMAGESDGILFNSAVGNAIISNDSGILVTSMNIPLVKFDCDLAGTGQLYISQSMEVACTGNNTYTGTTRVSTSNLKISGSHTGGNAYTVDTGSMLDVTGTIPNDLTLHSNSTLSPAGNETTILNINGNLDLTDGSGGGTGNIKMQVNGTTPGTDYDQISVTGTVNINGATLSISGTVNTVVEIVLIENDGAGDPVVGNFADLANGATVTINGQPFKIYYTGGDGNDVVLSP
ncbi:hypothetical protein KAJ27_22845, partial [bacterium]|nr:hypothetical protein [bacterium]